MNAYQTQGTCTWATPSEIYNAARYALGAIDLDPASDGAANELIHAAHYYSAEDDGFVKPWRGRVFLNPPGSQADSAVKRSSLLWLDRLYAGVLSGEVTSAIFIGYNAPEVMSKRPHILRAASRVVLTSIERAASVSCVTSAGRVNYGDGTKPFFPSVLVGFGFTHPADLVRLMVAFDCFGTPIKF